MLDKMIAGFRDIDPHRRFTFDYAFGRAIMARHSSLRAKRYLQSSGKPVPPTMSDLHNERVTAFTADKIESCFAFTTYLPRVSGKFACLQQARIWVILQNQLVLTAGYCWKRSNTDFGGVPYNQFI